MNRTPEAGRLNLLLALADEEVVGLVRKKVSKEQLALLIIEALNFHRDLSVADQATRDGVSVRTIQNRK